MLRLTLACGDYDRTRPLVDGRVRPLGIDLTCLPMTIEEIFFRMARFREFDAAEMSLGSFLVSLSAGEEAPFVAIPVFPSRSFRHSGIYVHAGSGIERPEQLAGRTVGVAEYQLTANIWIRGILAEHYGVPVASVRYRTGGLHEPGRPEKLAVSLPADVEVTPIVRRDRRALHAAHPALFRRGAPEGGPAVSRLPHGGVRLLADDGDLPDHARGRHQGRRLPA
jgi:4,5-dihydroxyphthalate decarboxylase